MSYDVFFQRLPDGIESIEDIPDDFRPDPIGPMSEVRKIVDRVMPGTRYDESGWGEFAGGAFSIEISLGNDDPVRFFALHIYGGSEAQDFVDELIRQLGLPALDGQLDNSIRHAGDDASESHARWEAYRDRVIGGG